MLNNTFLSQQKDGIFSRIQVYAAQRSEGGAKLHHRMGRYTIGAQHDHIFQLEMRPSNPSCIKVKLVLLNSSIKVCPMLHDFVFISNRNMYTLMKSI